jgi:hypothetical protein
MLSSVLEYVEQSHFDVELVGIQSEIIGGV